MEVFATLKDATDAAMAIIEQIEANSKTQISLFSTGASSKSKTQPRSLGELTEDCVKTFNP